MEWVEITANTVEAAKERALEQLGVAEGDAEIQIVQEPKTGLFGRVRGEARVRARRPRGLIRPQARAASIPAWRPKKVLSPTQVPLE